jgi:hypothetical protein
MECALFGDFNAKTAVLEDFSEPDETFLNVMDVYRKVQGMYKVKYMTSSCICFFFML